MDLRQIESETSSGLSSFSVMLGDKPPRTVNRGCDLPFGLAHQRPLRRRLLSALEGMPSMGGTVYSTSAPSTWLVLHCLGTWSDISI